MTLTRVSISSAFRVGAILYGLLWLVFGLIGLIFQGVLTAAVLSSVAAVNSTSFSGGSISSDEFGVMGALSIGSLVCAYLVGAVVAAIGGGISSALVAAFYNLAARLAGGLQFEVSGGYGAYPGSPIDQFEADVNYRRR